MDPELQSQLKQVLTSLQQLLPKPAVEIDWRLCYAANWRRHSFSGYLEAVDGIEQIALDDLFGIEKQKQEVENNIRQFLAGYPSNNTLLWGTRGTGKSSLIRAVLNHYAADGLRIVQVDKNDLIHLPDIVDAIKRLPYRFIIFSDDVSFEVGESSYKMLKSALDGAVYAPPDNIMICVTSNRRHLLPEYETDNRGAMLVNNEMHYGEAIEEKISLSGRFGLWIGFHPFTQDQYVTVTHQWVDKLFVKQGSNLRWTEETRAASIQWAYDKGDNSGRIAYQFALRWVGAQLLKQQALSKS